MQSPSAKTPLKLGTRSSPLALAQAFEVREKLCAHYHWDQSFIEIVTMKTTGDQFTDRPLSAIGGKGLFTKELELGLIDRVIDFAVHSMKDVATILPHGLKISAVLEREDVRDAFVSPLYRKVADLPQGAIVGTSSLRRKAQLLHKRPDLQVIEFRGTVQTRLRKLEEGQAVATFLAMAGLKRLTRNDLFEKGTASPIDIKDMLPAVAQAAIGIEICEDNTWLGDLLSPLNSGPSFIAITAERAFLRVLDGSCRTPIAAHYRDGQLEGEVLSQDGRRVLKGVWGKSGAPIDLSEAKELGEMAAHELLARGAANVLR